MKVKVLASVILAAAVAVAAEKKDVYDIRPDAKVSGAPTAAEWQGVKANASALAAATAPCSLSSHVATAEAADALAGKIRGAYLTDPLDAHVIGAVTQYVMMQKGAPWWKFWESSVAPERALWTASLLKRAASAKDSYVTQFCIDQLRWCATPSQAAEIAAIADKSSDKGVKSVAEMAVRELTK